MEITVNMHEAKTNLSQLVRRAEGDDILIARNGHPVVRLVRLVAEKRQLPWDALRGQLRMLEGFDDPVEGMKDYL